MSTQPTRPTDEIEPMIPVLPQTTGGRREPPTRDPERPPNTSYAAEYTRDYEKIVPGVPHY